MKSIVHVDDYGRSPSICDSILKSVTKGNVTSVSVMLGFVPDIYHFKLRETGCTVKLHLNLTEGIQLLQNN